MLYSAYGVQTTSEAIAKTNQDNENGSGKESTGSTGTAASTTSASTDPDPDPLSAAVTLYNTIGPIPTFAKPKAEVSLLAPEAFIGARVKVEWPGDDWYPGVVDRYDQETGRHHVFYDDGDTRWYTFTPDRKHAVSESENKLPLRFVGSTITDMHIAQNTYAE